ncbi:MAG TPA: group II intron reverse transcriptase/maturase [Kineosporiaceae bacterium]
MTTSATVAAEAGLVNGPEDGISTDPPIDWYEIDWERAEQDVRRLRQRIFAASRDGDLKRVRNLQKLMLRSRANALVSVRRVAEINAGRTTAGVDGKVALLASQKADLADWAQRRSRTWTARPVKRVFIPKAGSTTKLRPLGIPVIADRALQAVAVNALEPEWEARFEPRSYGFRPGRSCQDAIAAIFWTVAGRRTQRRWALDADLKAAFDHADHAHLLNQLGTFPAREAVAGWLKAGVIGKDGFAPTEEGTPQGGVISPLIFNICLHGMEAAAGTIYRWDPYRQAEATVSGTPVLVRYADDFVALCDSREQAEQVKTRLTPWLAARGLAFNEDKTRVVGLDEGLDFLGFTIRRYGPKLLIKPSKAAVKRVRNRLAAEMRALRGANASAVIRTLNPIVRGWAAYYRGVVSTETFQSLDHYVWMLTYKWALFRHNHRSRHRIITRYYGRFHPTRQDRWVFGDRESGAYLTQFAWTKIVRHDLVKGRASPDDPDLTQYWARRRRKTRDDIPPIGHQRTRLLRKQNGRCPICQGLLLHADHPPRSPEEWEQWAAATRKAITMNAVAVTGSTTDETERRLVHEHCRRRHRTRSSPANTAPGHPRDLPEPCPDFRR